MASYGIPGNVIIMGNVGIGTASPQYGLLHVLGSVSPSVTGGWQMGPSGTSSFSTSTQSVSVYGTNFFSSGQGYIASSDSRIKIDESAGDVNSLDKLSQILLRKYSYIDKISNGSRSKYGFFAQEIEPVIPEVVGTTSNFIPSVYRKADSVSSNVITIDNHGFCNGDRVRLLNSANKILETKIYNVTNNSFTLEESYSDDEIFVVGKEVHDFKVLDYDQISCFAVDGVKKLYSLIKTQQTAINSLEARIAALEAK